MADELVYLGVGSDRFLAQLIVEACRDEGLSVELLTADDSGVDPHLGLVQGHRLLIRADDLERVRAIVERTTRDEDVSPDQQ